MDSDQAPLRSSNFVQPIAPRGSGNESSSSRTTQKIAPAPKRPYRELKQIKQDSGNHGKSSSSSSRASGSKRAHKRTYQAVMSGPRLLLPLKKKDGEALWRKDIQYDFLNAVFTDQTKAFSRRAGGSERMTFAEIYLQTMASSTKCSKILGEKLLGDHQAGIKIAMVCLLVNWGRMNTTLNFFPEMKTVLRTYHPIPSLQTHDAQDYKQLQDAPRLKSILKGACEASNEPTSIHDLQGIRRRPRTNPINLVFLLSAFFRVVERDMIPSDRNYSYFDLLMDTTKTSESRARAFLWLVWAFLESPDFHDNHKNPFGPAIPFLEPLDEVDRQKENIDTPAELLFGNQMTLQRLSILDAPTAVSSGSGDDTAGSATLPNNNTPEKTAAAERAEKVNEVPLAIPKPRLRSAKDRRIHDEFNALVRLKRNSRKARRLARNNCLRDTWNRIKDLDPLYDSDEDRQQAKFNGKSRGIQPGLLATGLSTNYSDYGERSLSAALTLKRTAKRITENV